MRTHTSGFKTNISNIGREFSSIITYELNNETVTLDNEDLNAVTPHYKADILKSVMKQLDIDSNIDIPTGTVINYQFGVKVGESYEYLDYGNYIVNKSEKQEDLGSYKITCYDKMLLSMIEYENMNIIYPITIRDYISEICNYLGITFANSSDIFVNYDKELTKELFLGDGDSPLGYKFRDVLDQLAEVTASTICINDDDELEIRYITDSDDTIDETFFKNVNVDFGKKYGPINSVVLSRSGESDNIFEKDDESVAENGLCELKIIDNQILNDNDRDEYLEEIFEQLDGLEYYLNDYSSTGIMYYEMCDRYIAHIGDNYYSCVMLNDEALVTQGLQENVHTDLPIVSETEYDKADKTDRKINQTYLMVNKQNQQIESLVSTTTTIRGDLDVAEETIYNNNTEINNKLEEYQQTVSTQFAQTNQDFTFRFNNITDLITQVSETEDSHYSEIHRYIRFINGKIILGEENNPFTVELDNTKLSFKQSGTEIAYVSNNKLYITNSEVLTNLIIGNFQFIPRNNGSLSFKKVT